MTKFGYTITTIAIVAIVGLIWLLLPSSTGEDAADGGATLQVPVPGFEGVDEMIVSTSTDSMHDGGGVADDRSGEPMIFAMDGFNFGFSETEIRVKKGDTVRIDLTSTEGLHNWTIDEFGAETDNISVDEAASTEFVADQAGEFEYYCSVGNHRAQGMTGTLIVTE